MFAKLLQRVALTAALALTAVTGTNAQASEIPAVDRALTSIETSARAYDIAKGDLAAARAASDELAHRITALKRLHARGSDDALAQLLTRSVAAEEQITARTAARDARRKSLEKSVADTVQLIDDQIRVLKPDLKSADAARRALIAKQLKGLMADRDVARAALARTTAGERVVPKAWAQYEVKVEALDGPSDLREKADFVEDTRDKLKKKREAVQRLLDDARQEREVARATVNFRTEVGLFDEQSRTGRVAKSTDRAGTLAETTVSDKHAAGGANETAPPPAPTGQDPTNGFAASPAEGPAQRGSADNTDAVPVVPLAAAPALSTVTGVTGVVSAPLPKSVDPNSLLNFDVRALGTNIDVASMEALLKDLQSLESYLGERATVIRRRAQTLEADEASALRK